MKKEKFSGGLGALLVLAGSAVGLGNIWRFPYMVAENGGGAFILIYILCMLLVSVPVLLSEIALGRHKGNMKFHGLVNLLFVLIPTITLSYYSVIGGWTLRYMVFGNSDFGSFVSSTGHPLACLAIFLGATALIVLLGVRSGLEKFSKIMMPALFLIMCALAVYSCCMGHGSSEGLRFLFRPDFSKVGPETFVKALGQAFFSLSIGMGIMVTFGSYIDKDENLLATAAKTSVADLVFALISACVVIPALFAFGMFFQDPLTGEVMANPEADVVGAGLIFKTLPAVFSQMPMGWLVSVFFFLAVTLAALSSSISLFEVPVAWLTEKFGISRSWACLAVFLFCYAVGALCSLSFGVLGGISFKGMNIFDMLDWTTANVLMPLAGLICVLYAAWGMKKTELRSELSNSGKLRGVDRLFPILDLLIRYIAPAGVLAVALSGLIG